VDSEQQKENGKDIRNQRKKFVPTEKDVYVQKKNFWGQAVAPPKGNHLGGQKNGAVREAQSIKWMSSDGGQAKRVSKGR